MNVTSSPTGISSFASSLDSTLGALEVGSFFGLFLFGAITVQTYIYYSTYPKDPQTLKGLVSAVWVCELAHTISVGLVVYNSTITRFSQPPQFDQFRYLGVTVFFGGLITFLEQAFFAFRLLRILSAPYFSIFCSSVAFLRMIASCYASIQAMKIGNLQTFQETYEWLLTTLLAVGAAIDVLISVALCKYLIRQRQELSMMSQTGRLLNKLLLWTLKSGMLTSVSAVATLICFQVMDHNFVWLSVYVILAKLYSNSLLAALNARKQFRKVIGIAQNSSHNGGKAHDEERDHDNLAFAHPGTTITAEDIPTARSSSIPLNPVSASKTKQVILPSSPRRSDVESLTTVGENMDETKFETVLSEPRSPASHISGNSLYHDPS